MQNFQTDLDALGSVKETSKGLVIVYTGEGKGKTTASVGLAIRAAGRGMMVGFFQFFKKPVSGELSVLKDIDKVDVYSYVNEHPALDRLSCQEEHALKSAFDSKWADVKNIVEEKNFDVVILDEILVAVRDGFLEENELLLFLKGKKDSMDIVVTGRCNLGALISVADIVTDMKNIKHPFPRVKARKGIDF